MHFDILGFTTIFLSLMIPIVAITFSIWAAAKRHQRETELRRIIIENHTDVELARLLITEQQPRKRRRYGTLRTGMALLGLGLGGFMASQMEADGLYKGIVLAFGIGVGLISSFLIELWLDKHQAPQAE